MATFRFGFVTCLIAFQAETLHFTIETAIQSPQSGQVQNFTLIPPRKSHQLGMTLDFYTGLPEFLKLWLAAILPFIAYYLYDWWRYRTTDLRASIVFSLNKLMAGRTCISLRSDMSKIRMNSYQTEFCAYALISP